MYKLIRRYFGELCDKEQVDDEEVYDEEVVCENIAVAFVEREFNKLLQEDLENGYIIDKEQNKTDNMRLFLGEQENWNNYIEMFIIKDDKEVDIEIEKIVNIYDTIESIDFNTCLLSLEDKYHIHFQILKNIVSKKVIERRLKEYKGSRTISNLSFRQFVKDLEDEFECEIDLIDFTISPKLT